MDSGIGFTDNNFDSFETVDSFYKGQDRRQGPRPVSLVKAFTRVEIESHFHAPGADGLVYRKFSFVANDEDPSQGTK